MKIIFVLTDNGCKLKYVESLVYTKNGAQRTKLYYCYPQASWQKPHIEKKQFIRYVIPKGNSFDAHTQKNMTLLANYINSVAKDSLKEKCPFELAESFFSKKLLYSLKLMRIEPDMVLLKPDLSKN